MLELGELSSLTAKIWQFVVLVICCGETHYIRWGLFFLQKLLFKWCHTTRRSTENGNTGLISSWLTVWLILKEVPSWSGKGTKEIFITLPTFFLIVEISIPGLSSIVAVLQLVFALVVLSTTSRTVGTVFKILPRTKILKRQLGVTHKSANTVDLVPSLKVLTSSP